MRQVLVIGIGAGDPEHVTFEAVAALNAADVLFEIARATEDLTSARRAICERYLEPGRAPRVVSITEPRRNRTARGYGEAVEAWRAARAEVWERALDELARGWVRSVPRVGRSLAVRQHGRDPAARSPPLGGSHSR